MIRLLNYEGMQWYKLLSSWISVTLTIHNEKCFNWKILSWTKAKIIISDKLKKNYFSLSCSNLFAKMVNPLAIKLANGKVYKLN